MPVPADIREAVRKDLEARALRLDNRAVFDHRTNLMRAKIHMMLQHDNQHQLSEKEKQRKKIHQQRLLLQQATSNTNNKNDAIDRRTPSKPLHVKSTFASATLASSSSSPTPTNFAVSDPLSVSPNSVTTANTKSVIIPDQQQILNAAQNLIDESDDPANAMMLGMNKKNNNNNTKSTTVSSSAILATVSSNNNLTTTSASNPHSKFSNNPVIVGGSSASGVTSHSSRLSNKQAKEFLTKTRFGAELAQRLEKVNSSVATMNAMMAMATPDEISTSTKSVKIRTNLNQNSNDNEQQQDGGIQSGTTTTAINAFVARNAREAAIASDARVEKRLQQMMSSNTGTNSSSSSSPQQQQSSVTNTKKQDLRSPTVVNFTATTSTSSSIKSLSLAEQEAEFERRKQQQEQEQMAAEEEKKRRKNKSLMKNGQQQDLNNDDDDDDDLELTDEEKQLRREFRAAVARRRAVMNDHPVTQDDLQLQTTSGWVQRAMERKNLEDDEDLFQYRMKLKERDDKKRPQSPIDRYRKGFANNSSSSASASVPSSSPSPLATNSTKPPNAAMMMVRDKIPGSDTALHLGAGNAANTTVSLIPELHGEDISMASLMGQNKKKAGGGGGGVNSMPSHPSSSSSAPTTNSHDLLSASDDRRHRQQLVRFHTLLPEREKLAVKAGVELYESAPKLMSRDFDFMGDKGRIHQQQDQQRNEDEDEERKRNKINQNNNNNKSKWDPESSDSESSKSSDDEDDDDDDDDDADGNLDSVKGDVIDDSGDRQKYRKGSQSANASPALVKHQKLRDVIDLLESATVSACELIMSNNASSGALNTPTARSSIAQYRPTDATVIKNILKRALVILVPTVRKSILKAKRANASNTAAKINADYRDVLRQQAELKEQQQQLALLRSWLKGCEVWIASELGLDSHAGFFSVADKTHLKEFCSLYARMKQVSQRNAEVLMRRWQRQRDIMNADPTSLVSMDFYGKIKQQQQQQRNDDAEDDDGNNTPDIEVEDFKLLTTQHQPAATPVTLPAELSNFFNIIKIGSTNTNMMRTLFNNNNNHSKATTTSINSRMTSDKAAVIGKEAKEATTRYFETLEKFGIITLMNDNSNNNGRDLKSVDANNRQQQQQQEQQQVRGSALRLKNMLRKFAGIDDDDIDKYNQREMQRQKEEAHSLLMNAVTSSSGRRRGSSSPTHDLSPTRNRRQSSISSSRRPSSAQMLLEQAKHRADKLGKQQQQHGQNHHHSPTSPSSGGARRQSSASSTSNSGRRKSPSSSASPASRHHHQQTLDGVTPTTTVANLFQSSLMRSVIMGSDNSGNDENGKTKSKIITPNAEVASRVIATEAHDTVTVLELFIMLLGEPTQVYIREEIDNMLRYFHDTAPDRPGEVQSLDSSRDGERFFGFDPEEKRREKHALQAVHAQLLHLQSDDAKVDHNRIVQLRRAIDKTDAWVHISEDNTGVTAKHLALVSGESKNKNDTRAGRGGGTESATSRWHQSGTFDPDQQSGSSNNNNNNTNSESEIRTVAEERQRAQSLQKLAQVWKQLYVPFQYRMELLEKYRNAGTARVLAAEQRYTECHGAITKREALINSILDWANKMAAEDAANNIAQRQHQQQTMAAIRSESRTSTGSGGTTSTTTGTGTGTGVSTSTSARNNTNNANTNNQNVHLSSVGGAGRSASPGSSATAESYANDAESKRLRQQKKQQMLSDLTAATAACDVAIEKLSSIGEHLYYHQVLYATKMKDDFSNVTKVLRGGKDSTKE